MLRRLASTLAFSAFVAVALVALAPVTAAASGEIVAHDTGPPAFTHVETNAFETTVNSIYTAVNSDLGVSHAAVGVNDRAVSEVAAVRPPSMRPDDTHDGFFYCLEKSDYKDAFEGDSTICSPFRRDTWISTYVD